MAFYTAHLMPATPGRHTCRWLIQKRTRLELGGGTLACRGGLGELRYSKLNKNAYESERDGA